MKKKFLGRVLTMLLVASMVFTLLPAPAIAAGSWWWNNDEYTEEAVPTATTTADNSNFMRIFHLDCGRKYFSKEDIFNIIDTAANCGYTHVELAFGNDGLRFLLKDMSLTANGKEYGSDDVKAAIQYGNMQYNSLTNYNQSTNELTEDEMREILAHASEVGIGIIPMFDAPGHMYALIKGMQDKLQLTANYRYATKSGENNSQNWALILTDANNADSVAFVKALMQKYIQFFAENGAKYFNIAADECGFVSTRSGTSINDTNGEYAAFAGFVNEMNSYVKSHSMTTMAFNDGFYHKGMQIADGSFDTDILICYWDASKEVYAQAAELAQKGFRIINTNNRWYYVIGKEQSTGSDWSQYAYHLDYAIERMGKEDCLTIDGDGKQTTPVGCMTAVWCDNPGADYHDSSVKRYMAAMQSSNPDYFKSTAAPDKPGTKLDEREITVMVGDTTTDTIKGNYGGTYKTDNEATAEVLSATAAYVPGTSGEPVLQSALNEGKTYIIGDGSGNYLKRQGTGLLNTNNPEDATQWLVTKDPTYEAYNLANEGYYLSYYVEGTYNNRWELNLRTDNTKYSAWTYQNNAFKYYSSSYNYYLKTSNGAWVVSRGYSTTAGSAYTKEASTEGGYQTTITFKGLAEGDTYVTIGNVHYTIHVTREDLSKAPTLPIQLWITNNSIQPTDDKDFGKTGKFYTAGGTWQSQWAYYYPISADLRSEKNTDSVNSENGMALSECIPSVIQNRYQYGTNYWATDKGNHTPYNFTLWRGEVFNTSTGFQKSGQASMLNKGIADFQYVRYLNNAWQVSLDRSDWTTVTGEGSTGSVSSCKEQLVAYYYMQTELTEEVTTNVLDWGDAVNSQTEYALLDFAVKYPSGTRVPTTFIQPEKTRVYNTSGEVVTEGNYRLVDEISVIKKQGFEVYMITLTPATGLSGKISSTTQYQYEKTGEKVVWVDKVEDLPDDFKDSDRWYVAHTNTGASRGLTFDAENGTNVGGDAIVPMVEIEKNSGTLVTYYIRPVKEETDTLQVNYVDLSDNNVFYDYSIAVKSGTTFDKEPTLTNGKLIDYTIQGLKATETVYSDLTKMDGVPAAYRYATNITCERVERSEGNKTLTLYYRFGRTTSFVVDFGLPVTIQPGDLNTTLGTNIKRIKKVTAVSSDGAASVVDKNVVFTPNKVYGVGSAKLAITYSGTNPANNGENSVTYTVDVLPASNVLYEENFLTQSNESGRSWTEVTSTKLGSQETQKVNGTGSYNVFGYDAAYVTNGTKPVTGELGVWTASGLEFSTMTKALTTEFYGNGFDLIGNCGPTTGRVMIAFTKQGAATPCRVVMVNTRFNDSSVATTLHQVPWAHVELGVDDAMYKVEIFASGNETNSSSRTMLASSYAAETDAFDSILAAYGMSASDVEYINVADTITVPSAYAVSYASVAANVPANQTIEVDGFRVYRSTTNDNYPANEKNVTYENILDVVKGEITAYTENGNGGAVQVTEYEKNGGPQNEIYLSKGQSVTFQVGTAPSEIQVSLRAVSDTTSWATSKTGDNPASITSNTEMYYPVTTNSDGSITIVNRGEGLLAIGNVKLPDGAVTQSASEMDKDVVLASVRMALGASGEGDTFDPAISAKVTTTRFIRSKVVTLTVSASADVEKLMVNGVELRPTNSWLVKMGWSDTYTYILTEKVQKNEIKTYEIVGYRADGAASAPIVVKSK